MENTKYFPRGCRIFKIASDLSTPMAFFHDCCTCLSHPLTEFLVFQQYITISLQTAQTQFKCCCFSLDQGLSNGHMISLCAGSCIAPFGCYILVGNNFLKLRALGSSNVSYTTWHGFKGAMELDQIKEFLFCRTFLPNKFIDHSIQMVSVLLRIWYGWNTILYTDMGTNMQQQSASLKRLRFMNYFFCTFITQVHSPQCFGINLMSRSINIIHRRINSLSKVFCPFINYEVFMYLNCIWYFITIIVFNAKSRGKISSPLVPACCPLSNYGTSEVHMQICCSLWVHFGK